MNSRLLASGLCSRREKKKKKGGTTSKAISNFLCSEVYKCETKSWQLFYQCVWISEGLGMTEQLRSLARGHFKVP